MDNLIPYIRVANFTSVAACEELSSSVFDLSFGKYREVEPPIDRIGCTVFEYDAIGRRDYFADTKRAAEVQDELFSRTFNPLSMLMSLLSRSTGRRTTIARNGDGQSYYAGLVRRIEQGTLLHVDYAPAEQNGWEICDIKHQLSWNLYLKVGSIGSGQTTVYQRQWKPEDNRYKERRYGFDHEVIAGSEHAIFQPVVGEVVLFNTRNYHMVDPSRGIRITVTSAIGETPRGDLILWS